MSRSCVIVTRTSFGVGTTTTFVRGCVNRASGSPSTRNARLAKTLSASPSRSRVVTAPFYFPRCTTHKRTANSRQSTESKTRCQATENNQSTSTETTLDTNTRRSVHSKSEGASFASGPAILQRCLSGTGNMKPRLTRAIPLYARTDNPNAFVCIGSMPFTKEGHEWWCELRHQDAEKGRFKLRMTAKRKRIQKAMK